MTFESYTQNLNLHYERYFGTKGTKHIWPEDPHLKMYPEFYVLTFAPNNIHNMWIYCTIGMSLFRDDDNLIELFIFSPQQDDSIVELLTVTASYHINGTPLNIHHTFNVGRSWLNESDCEYCFISLPYLDGENFEVFQFQEKEIHCYWLIPITETEKNYKVEFGYEALEQLFENNGLDYLNPNRKSLV
jgi:hypothetical protein